MSSLSHITGQSYSIPDTVNDQTEIDAFVDRHKDKKIVVVQGLGFVGAVMSLVVANSFENDFAVIGIDLPTQASYWKIQEINSGPFPVLSSDPKVEQFYQVARERGNLMATADPYAYSLADIIVVDINLDVQKVSDDLKALKDFSVDLTPFKKACGTVAQHCKDDVLVLVETTVPPGTCRHVVKPIFDKAFSERGLEPKYALGHSYERVMPGPNYIDSIQNFYRVYSGIDQASAARVDTFLRKIIKTDEYPLTQLGDTTATEMAKVLENSYRAMNIAFVEEWGQFAEEAGVNLYEIVHAIRMRPTHKNMMLPGLGVGGYCLTKDPLMASWAKQTLFNSDTPLKQSVQAVTINDQMPLRAASLVKKALTRTQGKQVLFLGVSYLNDVGDTRYTPIELLFDEVVSTGADVTLHDSFVPRWEERDLPVSTDLASVLETDYDVIVLTTMHSEYKQTPLIAQYLQTHNQTALVDTWGVLDLSQFNGFTNPIYVLGRGDLS